MRRDGRQYQEAMELAPRARHTEFLLPLRLAAPQPGETIVDCPSGGAYMRGFLEEVCDDCHYIPFETKPDYAAWVGDLVLGDWLHLPFADGSVDVLISLTTLHHLLEGREEFYREASRVLAPGGRLVVADVACGTAPARWLDHFVDRFSSPGHTARFHDAAEESAAMRAAGLVVTHGEQARYTWDFSDPALVVPFMQSLFRLDLASPEQVGAAVEEILGFEGGRRDRVRWELLILRADRPR